jgi:PmbA protein
MKHIINYAKNAILKAGADKAAVTLVKTEKHELNVASGEISLFRTTFDTNLYLSGILEDKKGSSTINKLDEASIDAAAEQVLDLARSSQADKANEFAEKQEPEEFKAGNDKADLDQMYFRLQEFMKHAGKAYPKAIIEEINFDFTKRTSYYVNSNDVDFRTDKGVYTFVVMFTSKDGTKTSSFNYAAYQTKDLDKPFKNCGSIDRLLKQSEEQLETHAIPEKFVGNVIVTPDCMDDIIGNLIDYLYDFSLITGNSVYKDKLGEVIADSKLTLHSMPLSKELSGNYFVTGDGYKAQNSTIIDKGVLKTFLLGLYGANKTGNAKAVNSGGCNIIDAGDVKYDEIIKDTKQGLLLCRFSGGNPSDNGDFSGVAKNSYYIENGEIKYPVSETMISGNLVEMIKNIVEISTERINTGYQIYPWIKFDGVTVSGK